MSKLDELDESFGLEFGSYEALYEKRQSKNGEWCLIDDILKFARKYYLLGKLEEREAMKKMVEGAEKMRRELRDGGSSQADYQEGYNQALSDIQSFITNL